MQQLHDANTNIGRIVENHTSNIISNHDTTSSLKLFYFEAQELKIADILL